MRSTAANRRPSYVLKVKRRFSQRQPTLEGKSDPEYAEVIAPEDEDDEMTTGSVALTGQQVVFPARQEIAIETVTISEPGPDVTAAKAASALPSARAGATGINSMRSNRAQTAPAVAPSARGPRDPVRSVQ